MTAVLNLPVHVDGKDLNSVKNCIERGKNSNMKHQCILLQDEREECILSSNLFSEHILKI